MILDFGCGDGHRWNANNHDIVGIDPNLLRLKQAKTRVAVIRCDGRFLPFTQSVFSLVISDSVLEHIQGIRKALLEMKRVLAVDGTIRIVQPVDNDPIFIVARRVARSWMGDRVYSYFSSRYLLNMTSSILKLTSVGYVPNSPFAGLFGFFSKKPPALLQRMDGFYEFACRRTGFFHWQILVEGTKR
jgi:ubiquinone/menaquinone biosynthesis C-methylase UbiE